MILLLSLDFDPYLLPLPTSMDFGVLPLRPGRFPWPGRYCFAGLFFLAPSDLLRNL